jgi:pimeloyl-ACP methyl ester carboxylesterase
VVEALSLEGLVAGAVLGHSFGGKVAMALARRLGEASRPLEHLFVVDSTPGARPDGRGSAGVREIVELLMQLPDEFPDRDGFTAWIEARGVSRPVAMWLAMNVRRVDGDSRFVFRMDVPQVRAMMKDYFDRDYWSVFEHPEPTRRTHLIAGGKSQVIDDVDLERARGCPRTTVDVIAEAGHWVHVDAPDALRDLVLSYVGG